MFLARASVLSNAALGDWQFAKAPGICCHISDPGVLLWPSSSDWFGPICAQGFVSDITSFFSIAYARQIGHIQQAH
jgi:hypothetical protein